MSEEQQPEPEPAARISVQHCRHCKSVAVLCDEHAGALVAQAFTEDAANRREGAARAAERKLRQGSQEDGVTEDAQALRHVLVRWFGSGERGALARARELVRQLEEEEKR